VAATGAPASAPIGADEFAGLMASLGPFEKSPELAVAVSGGADSMALCLLADDWARHRRGRAWALIVDHALRPESGDEARRVAGWLAARSVAATVLRWEGAKPAADVQAAAREARYRLMTGWCRDGGVLHLLLAHHRGDQAETVLLRLGRGSGLDGLAAMAAVVEMPALRLLRPFLGVPGRRLRATLKARGQPWVEDPSNRDPRYARVRLRALSAALAAEGLSDRRLAAAAAALGRARSAMEAAVAGLLAAAVVAHPAGFCRLDLGPCRGAPEDVARRALVRMLLCVGGGVYPPRGARLERLYRSLMDGSLGSGRTLAGCRVVPRRDGVLICREPAAAKGEVALSNDAPVCWDARFVVRAALPKRAARRRYGVRRLGRVGWTEVAAARPSLRATAIPGAVRPSLPAVFDLDGVVAVPHLGFVRSGLGDAGAAVFSAAFRPAQPLGPAAFAFAGAARYDAIDQ
jgi:tRNA(Ile)-lysidine synthase